VRIGDVARLSGASVRSLRYYEEQGLLTSERSPSGQRHYTDREVERVEFIQRLYAAGLSSRTIVQLLPCVDAPSEQTSVASLARLREERDRLDRHIAELLETRATLEAHVVCAENHLRSAYDVEPGMIDASTGVGAA
jgi:DNA-binding transcriptional MerR regulator